MNQSAGKQDDGQHQAQHEHSHHGSVEQQPESISGQKAQTGHDQSHDGDKAQQQAQHVHSGHADPQSQPADNHKSKDHSNHKPGSSGDSENQHADHKEHDHTSHAEVFKRRFFISLLIGVPILFLAPMMGVNLPFQFSFPGKHNMSRLCCHFGCSYCCVD